ncbi:hypothetical protein [Halobaculum gomorrense]|uniref:hypothetical protein n=1 Tax=Halobaculum gomorrense TaxID=43928 RepID=UPI00093556CE|nr:hypothetical protein [Halobaculum gomorrense]
MTGQPDRATPDLELAEDGCWKLTSGIAQTMEYGTVEILAGGTLTAFVGLYASHEAAVPDGCFLTGEFRFDATDTDMSDGRTGGENPPSASWGFDLRVDPLDRSGSP